MRNILEELIARYAPIVSIGIDGQMHGILYVDRKGDAVSPLYTWQDGRGDERLGSGTYASVLSELTGYPMASGFGLTTHYWFERNRLVPVEAHKLCSLFDYIAMKLTGRSEPLMHISGAASLGMFHLETGNWDRSAKKRAEMTEGLLPFITADCMIVGYESHGIPVSCGIGDNQASFLGAVKYPQKSVLINMGTGGQVSMLTRRAEGMEKAEIRPFGGTDSCWWVQPCAADAPICCWNAFYAAVWHWTLEQKGRCMMR